MANSFKTLLDHFGGLFKVGVSKAIVVEQALRPTEELANAVVTTVNPALGAGLSGVLGAVVGVEQVATAVNASTGTGQQKLAAAIPGVEAAILSDPIFKGKVPANLPLYNLAIESVTKSFADLLNSFPAPAGAAQ
jgi:hypothetical protein